MNLAKLREFAEKRTMERWDCCYDGSSDWSVGLAEDPQTLRICGVERFQGDWDAGSNNAAFIAAAANHFDAMLAVCDAAKEFTQAFSVMFHQGSGLVNGPKTFECHDLTARLKEALQALEAIE
jgi:hypothetical protein